MPSSTANTCFFLEEYRLNGRPIQLVAVIPEAQTDCCESSSRDLSDMNGRYHTISLRFVSPVSIQEFAGHVERDWSRNQE